MKSKLLLKGIILLFSINLLLLTDLSSQSLYIRGGLGYSVGVDKDYYHLRSDYSQISTDTSITNSVHNLEKISFGQGPNFEIVVGGFIGKNLSIELGGFYHTSNSQTLRYEDYNDYDGLYYINFSSETVVSGKTYGLKPNILLWLGGYNFRPYFKLGAVIGFGSIKEETEFRVFNTHPMYYPTESYTSVFEYKSNFDFGFTAGAGFEIYLFEGTKFYCELNYTDHKQVPHSGKYTEYKYRDQSIIEGLTVSELEYEYVDEYTSSDNISESSPTKQLKQSFSFSNVGIMVGIKVNLINKSEQE